MSKEEIKAFMDASKIDQPATVEEFTEAVLGAYKDRTRQVYFIWRKLKELYPEVDANRVIREGSYDFGLYQGEQIAQRYGGRRRHSLDRPHAVVCWCSNRRLRS